MQHPLSAFLNAMSRPEQVDFAKRCGTTVGSLRKAISARCAIREKTCIHIERESGRRILCEQLRPDVDWAFIRGTAATVAALANTPAANVTPLKQAA